MKTGNAIKKTDATHIPESISSHWLRDKSSKIMKAKIFCMIVLCTGLLVGCDKEPVIPEEPARPPVEQPEEPEQPSEPDEPESPEKVPSTDDIVKTKIGDINMIVGSNNWNDIAYGNGKYVVVGGDKRNLGAAYITTSINGVDWSEPKVFTDLTYFSKVIFINGKFIASGGYQNNSGNVLSSTDGLNWSNVSVGYANIRGIAFGNGVYVVTNGYFTYVSSNLITWDFVDTQVGNLYDIIFINGKFAASCNKGYVLSSTDGKTWIPSIKAGNTTWYSIAYGNGKFVAVGCENYAAPSPGKVIMSTNGTTWTNPKQITPNRIYNVRFINEKFVAVGENGYITTSIDGINWTTPEQIKDESGNVITADLNGICAMP